MKLLATFIIFMVCMYGLSNFIHPYVTDAKPESITRLKVLTDSTDSNLDNEALIALLKRSPVPTVSELDEIEESVIELITIEQSRQITNDTTLVSSLEKEIQYEKIVSEGKQLSWNEKNHTQKLDAMAGYIMSLLAILIIIGMLYGVIFRAHRLFTEGY